VTNYFLFIYFATPSQNELRLSPIGVSTLSLWKAWRCS